MQCADSEEDWEIVKWQRPFVIFPKGNICVPLPLCVTHGIPLETYSSIRHVVPLLSGIIPQVSIVQWLL